MVFAGAPREEGGWSEIPAGDVLPVTGDVRSGAPMPFTAEPSGS